MREDFRPILGYEGHYEINSEGVVVSLYKNKRTVVKSRLAKDGYRIITLSVNKQKFHRRVHRLVWEAFNGKIPEKLYVVHGKNTNRCDCQLEVLSLGTPSDNAGRDRSRDGTLNIGSKNGQTKLSVEQVKYIKQRLLDNVGTCTLVKLFDVTEATIRAIKTGKTWSHVI